MVKVLDRYYTQYKLKTVYQIIRRWAPPAENNTDAYAKHVAEIVGVEPDSVIDLEKDNILIPLLKAIVLHENGQQPYDEDTFKKAVALARMQ